MYAFESTVLFLFLFFLTDSLLIDYQFTFSLLQEDDRHHTAINFIANPEQVRKLLPTLDQFWRVRFKISVVMRLKVKESIRY